MAENAVKYVASAVTAELTSRVFSALVRRYSKDAATGEKLRRLELLLAKIHSAIEVSEKCTIENSSLRRWRGKLKDAAAEGDEVLTSFLPAGRAVADGQAQASNGDKQEGEAVSAGEKQEGEAVSSSALAPAADVSVAGNSLSDIVQGICNVFFFPDDMERLNRTLGSLEKLSPDIGHFITLLHLETLAPKVIAPPPDTAVVPTGATETTTGETRKRRVMKRSGTHPKKYRGFIIYERELLQDRLDQALPVTVICKAVELADNHDLEDLEWLSYWAANLREAKGQGRDVLGTCKTQDNEKQAVGCDEEEDGELGTFVHWQEALARDVAYFRRLVYLSPARVTVV